MKHYYRYITDRYLFRIVTSLLLAGAVMYPFFQKYFDAGIMAGSVKG